MSKKTKKAQNRILDEIKSQLIAQAERWGKKDYYTPLKLEEMEIDQCQKILGDLLAEKNNLEYEMAMLGSDKREVLIKTERLNSYIKKAHKVIDAHARKINKMINNVIGDQKIIDKAESLINKKPRISVEIGE